MSHRLFVVIGLGEMGRDGTVLAGTGSGGGRSGSCDRMCQLDW